MPRGSNRPKGAPALKGAGRPPKYTTLRVPTDGGRFPLAIPVETIGQAQRLLLDYPECRSVEEIIALAVAALVEAARQEEVA
jgi:hypothetical protein